MLRNIFMEKSLRELNDFSILYSIIKHSYNLKIYKKINYFFSNYFIIEKYYGAQKHYKR